MKFPTDQRMYPFHYLTNSENKPDSGNFCLLPVFVAYQQNAPSGPPTEGDPFIY